MISVGSVICVKREISSERLVLSVSEDKVGNILLNSNIEFCDYKYCVVKYKEVGIEKKIVFLKLYDNFHLRHFNHNGNARFQMVLFYCNKNAKTPEIYKLEDFDAIYYLNDNYKNYNNLSDAEIINKVEQSKVIWENSK